MRRKSTRTAAKPSPEKVKDEKPAKKSRRLSKRHKQTSSESDRESDDEISLSSNDNGTNPSEKELWTVTQTEQSTNDIGKIKICLARPSPATPERSSKRLRNRSGGALAEDSSPSEDVKLTTTRRSRRRGGGGSSPEPLVEEKKGKGKSKGKHKSKIVEQAADDDDENTEMQSELSANVQVTPQSPPKESVDKAAADLIVEHERNANDSHDNSVSNVEHSVLVQEERKLENVAGDVATDAPQAVDTIDEADSLVKKDNAAEKQNDVSETAADEIKPEIQEDLQENVQIPTSPKVLDANIEDCLEIEPKCEAIEEESIDAVQKEDVSEIDNVQQQEKEEKMIEEQPEEHQIEEEIKSPVNTESESIKEEKKDTEEKQENEIVIEEVQSSTERETEQETPAESVCEEDVITEDQQSQVEVKVEEETTENEEISIQLDVIDCSETILQSHDEETVEESTNTADNAPNDEENEEKQCKTPENKEIELEIEENQAKLIESDQPPKIPQIKHKSWGEGIESPKYLIVTMKKLQEMYPDLTLQDESSVKLTVESNREQNREYIVERPPIKDTIEARTEIEVSKMKKPAENVQLTSNESEDNDADMICADIVTENGTSSNTISLHRKISIVEDDARVLQSPSSPAKHEKSDVLFITNLVRPFTVKQLRGLLERTGKITQEGFWTDKIKSKCYVQYETEEEAEATRNALHGVLWPVGNGKKLMIDYAMQQDLENAKNPPVIAPIAPVEDSAKDEEKQMKDDFADVPINKESQETSTLWNEEYKETNSNRRSITPEAHKRPHRQRSRSFSGEPKQKIRRDEPHVHQRAMDDLFRKTSTVPSIYWQSLTPEEIELKQQQRQERMEAHKRKLESEMLTRRNSDPQQRQRVAPYRRRY